MKIAIVGAGHVGLVAGACFADSGHEVSCIDIDEAKVEQLSQGKVPIHEPGLQEMVRRNAAAGRLHFTSRFEVGLKSAAFAFLTVSTPVAEDGAADLTALWNALDKMALYLPTDVVVAIKSTVPVGTHAKVYDQLAQRTGRECDVASNPEFLKEGAAVADFLFPDRVVVGVSRQEVAEKMRELYATFLRTDRPFLVMAPASAELTKYATSALLSTKISFINELANCCEGMAADIDDVRCGIGHDSRLGFAGLFPGAGYGGSCLPADMRVLSRMARDWGVTPRMMEAVNDVNEHQKAVLFHKIQSHFQNEVKDKTIALWGLAFKARTDDVREASALVLIERLLDAGARLCVHDPLAMANVRACYGDQLLYGSHPMDVLVGADALAINTEWGEYRNPDIHEMRQRMAAPVVFDGRNLYCPKVMEEAGFKYYGIGR